MSFPEFPDSSTVRNYRIKDIIMISPWPAPIKGETSRESYLRMVEWKRKNGRDGLFAFVSVGFVALLITLVYLMYNYALK